MLNDTRRNFKLIIRNLYLVSFQNAFTHIALGQPPNNPLIRLGGAIQPHSPDWKTETWESIHFVQGQKVEKR